MNFGMLLPPSAGRGRGRGGAPPVAVTAPRESVTAIFHVNKIVLVELPYMTPRSGPIRSFCQVRLLNEQNERLLVFRPNMNNSWTNIHLQSTAAAPRLTAQPDEMARKLCNVLTQCPDVSNVILKNEAGETLTMEQAIELPYQNLEDNAVNQAVEEEVPDVSVTQLAQLVRDVFERVVENEQAVERKLVQVKTELTAQLTYIIDVLDKNVRQSQRDEVARIQERSQEAQQVTPSWVGRATPSSSPPRANEASSSSPANEAPSATTPATSKAGGPRRKQRVA